MKSKDKARLLAITDPGKFKRALQEIFPGQERITLADIGMDVCRHLYKNVIKADIANPWGTQLAGSSLPQSGDKARP